MKTKHKIALARLAWRGMRTVRTFSGAGMTGQFSRGGLAWKLDLDEGIDFSIFLLGAFEPGTVRFYRRALRPGDIVFDIGANIGAHTLPFAQCVAPNGKVFAFEPTQFAYGKLLENISLNPQLKELIVPNHMFLTAPGLQDAPGEIYSSWPLKPAPELHEKHLGQLRLVGEASIGTLDEYCREKKITRLDWVKIDVDGNEMTVLQGAADTLKQLQPSLIMELSPYACREAGHSFEELVKLVRNFGYDLYDLENGSTLPSDAADLDALIPDGSGLNAVLKPAAQVHGLRPSPEPADDH